MVKPRCEECPFSNAKKEAQVSANTVLNYKLALTSFTYTEVFKKRDLMIMDEAHTLERHLVDFDSVDITYARCKRYELNFKVQTTIESAIDWIKDTYLPKMEEILSDMESDYEYLYEKAGTEITRSELAKLKEIDELADHISDVLQMSVRTTDYLNEHFVLVHDKTMFQFKRLHGSYSFKKILEPMANRFLFMSSTILNKTSFCYDLGINPDDAAFLSLDSDFPVENRPVYYMPVMKMNASWNKPEQASDRKRMIKRIIDLLEIHKDESGILHTANYQVAMWLVKELSDNIEHDIYHHNPDDDVKRNEAIQGFMESNKPAILISPSSTEGLDLKDDLSRFSITVKTPFGYLGDQWIKRRMEMSNEWYRRRAMIDIIQGGGRIVRSSEDHGTVYILDESFGYLYTQSIGMIPNWWKESYQVI
jgi:Rad3-related DNA helicase